MNKNIKIWTIAILLMLVSFANAQQDVILTVMGQGATKEKAKLNAFRNAIESTYGSFISSNTQILNDDLVKDEIVSVSSGNIKNFNVLSEVQLPSGEYATTIKAMVSVSNLTSFCESKGIAVDFKGSLFAQNIKLQKLNEDNETTVIKNLIYQLKTIQKDVFNYELIASEPKKYKNSDDWSIILTVSIQTNNNFSKINSLLINTLEGLSMSTKEQKSYKDANKKVFDFKVMQTGKKNKYYQPTNTYIRMLKDFKNVNGKGYSIVGKDGKITKNKDGKEYSWKNKAKFDDWFSEMYKYSDKIMKDIFVNPDSLKYYSLNKYLKCEKKDFAIQNVILRNKESISLLENYFKSLIEAPFNSFNVYKLNANNTKVILHHYRNVYNEPYENYPTNIAINYSVLSGCSIYPSGKEQLEGKKSTSAWRISEGFGFHSGYKPNSSGYSLVSLSLIYNNVIVASSSINVVMPLNELENISSFIVEPKKN